VKKSIIIFSVAALLIAIGVAWYQGLLADFYADYPEYLPLEARQTNERIKVIAHRGDTTSAPENTLESFRAAIAGKMDYIEVDVRLTADGVPVVLHDRTVDRTTDGEGSLNTLSYAEVQQLDAGSWFSPEFAGARIPMLAEVLALSRGKVCVYIDLKGGVNYQLAKILKQHASSSEPACLLVSIVMPSDYKKHLPEDVSVAALAKIEAINEARGKLYLRQHLPFKRYWPEVPLALPYREGVDLAELLNEYPGVVALEVNPLYVSRETIEKLHALGFIVYSRVSITEERFGKEKINVLYSKLMESAIDLVFLDEPLAFEEFQDAYLSGQAAD
jgi:glycerophosphoryl diester phosphodiesterase